MWLFTRIGFFSVVQKKGEAQLTIRSRAKTDLDALRSTYLPALTKTQVGGGTDYPYRATATRKDVAAALARMVEDLTYSNFKDAVAQAQGSSRADLYHDVWDVMRGVTEQEQAKAARKFGGVLLREDGCVLLREPTNHFDGYVWTFAKGAPNRGETPQEAALREVREETGWHAEIIEELEGRFGDGETRYFLLRPVEDHRDFDRAETASVLWATIDEARALISKTRKASGRVRDLEVLSTVERIVASRRGR